MSRGLSARVAAAVAVAALAALCMLAGPLAGQAPAEELAPAWRFEPVLPPVLPGVPESKTPIGLGKVGDLEFWAPNRGLLITAGNAPSVPPGLWAYDGVSWHELATVCGATDGRIAWAGPEEFWTVSDGRPGQAATEHGSPPLEDNTLCHFASGGVAASFASLAFKPDSYQAMHGASCFNPGDCWFAGNLLPEGQVGSFHLHWNGSTLGPTPNPQGRTVLDLRRLGRRLYESVRITTSDLITPPESALEPSALHTIAPSGVAPTFVSLRPESSTGQQLPIRNENEFPAALDYLQLSSAGEELWTVANPISPPPSGSAWGEVTILHLAGGVWSQVLGPTTDPAGGNPFTKFSTREQEEQNEVVTSIAANPGTESAWLSVNTKSDVRSRSPLARAVVARIGADGTISERQTLPSATEEEAGIGPKGGAEKITCPAPDDCWLTTTQGWVYHLSDEAHRYLPRDTAPAFAGLITFRPPDQGVPSIVPDAPPIDDSGLRSETPTSSVIQSSPLQEVRIPVALLTHLRARLVRGTTLELKFHLAVKARIRLIARRRKSVVGRTPLLTMNAGNRKLLLALNRNRWPTKLDLQTRALVTLPTESTRSANVGTIGTSFNVLPQLFPSTGSGSLP
jgi:hypothetical protein